MITLVQSAKGEDQAAFEELLARYTPLIDAMTARFCSADATVQDREDLRQEAVLAFYRALQHFETAQTAVTFGNFAKLCIRNALVSHLRSIKRHEALILLEDEELPEVTDGTDLPQLVAEEESYLSLARLVHDNLSEYENRIWWLYLSGRTARQIAWELGRDERSVQNAVYRIRQKLRRVIPQSQDMPE